MDGIDALRVAIESVPIPSAPPRLSRDGAAVGLAFLDTALRQNHVRRLTERLALVNHGTARCTTEVDISLGLLDDGQRRAGSFYQSLRNRMDHGGGTDHRPVTGDVVWVPVSRISRRSQAPIDVTDGSGAKLPRLTQYEVSRLLSSALYRLLRAILAARAEAHEPDTPLYNFLHRSHEARWLLLEALLALLTERSKPTLRPAGRRTPGTVPGTGWAPRGLALDVLSASSGSLEQYYTLLDVAINDYLLIVALDAQRDDHALAFDTPLHRIDRGGLSPLRPLRLAGGAYQVEYQTRLPANLRAYHLVAETEPGLEIATMHLSSTADRGLVTELCRDLRTLSHRVRGTSPGASPSARSLLELELGTCLRRLSEVVRRRRWEGSQAGRDLTDRVIPATANLAWVSTSGEAAVAATGAVDNTLQAHPLVTADALATAAREIERTELTRDLSIEKGPPSDRAHVYWRRHPSRVEVDQNIDITSSIFLRDLRDGREDRPGAVVAYVASVVGISYLMGCLIFSSPFPYLGDGPVIPAANADAIIGVLLLVPGFLYTRLSLPSRQSIAGHLRALPRVVAHVTIGCTAVVAATIAAGAGPHVIRLALAICAILPITGVLLMLGLSWVVRGDLLSADPRLPRWIRRSAPVPTGDETRRRFRRARIAAFFYRVPDAVYRTVGR